MAQPRPSLTLILDIDERLDSEALRLEIDRCYTYVGSTLVRTHPAPPDGGDAENTARILVKLGMHKYLNSSDKGADALWNEVLERWLYNALHKVGNNMKIFNRRQRDIEGTELFFSWIDVDLENGALSVCLHCDSASGINPEVSTMISALRNAYNAGVLGSNITRVYMPTHESYTQQMQEGIAAQEEREALEAHLREVREAEERALQEAREAKAEAAFLESPSLVEQTAATPASPTTNAEQADVSQTTDAQDGANAQNATLVAQDEESAPEDPFAVDEALFEVDYNLWGIVYADGTNRIYDHQHAVFVD